jgi:hypothetical protein
MEKGVAAGGSRTREVGLFWGDSGAMGAGWGGVTVELLPNSLWVAACQSESASASVRRSSSSIIQAARAHSVVRTSGGGLVGSGSGSRTFIRNCR